MVSEAARPWGRGGSEFAANKLLEVWGGQRQVRNRVKTTAKDNFCLPLSFSPKFSANFLYVSQRAPNPPEFAQPRLSRVKGWSSPARGYQFGPVLGVFVPIWPVSSHANAMTPVI